MLQRNYVPGTQTDTGWMTVEKEPSNIGKEDDEEDCIL